MQHLSTRKRKKALRSRSTYRSCGLHDADYSLVGETNHLAWATNRAEYEHERAVSSSAIDYGTWEANSVAAEKACGGIVH